jgi:hypothetical protein
MNRHRTAEQIALEFNLTELEAAFVWHSRPSVSGARAAREAGYSTKNAKRIAWAVSQRPRVQEALKIVQAEGHPIGRYLWECEHGRPFPDPIPEPLDLEQMIHRLANSSAKWRKNFRLAGIKYTREK